MSQKTSTYLISWGFGNPVKIGRTDKLCRRISHLQVSCPYDIELLALIDGDVEGDLHSRFASSRLRGEWYSRTSELDDFITSLDPSLVRSYSESRKKCSRCESGLVYGTHTLTIQNEDGSFSGYCLRCKMVLDGRALDNEKSPRPPHGSKECARCLRRVQVTRHGLCSACGEYRRRTGRDRPIPQSKPPCLSCGDGNRWQVNGRCSLCHMKWCRSQKQLVLSVVES